MKRPGGARIRVFNSDGKPAGEVGIFARNEAGQLVDNFSFVQTSPAGIADYGGLAPGRYTFFARGANEASTGSPPVEVKSGETAEAELQLQVGTRLIVSLVDDQGNSVHGKLRLVSPDGSDMHGMWSITELHTLVTGEGYSLTTRTFGPLPNGRYKVFATLPNGETLKKPVTLRGRGDRKLKLRVRD